MSDQTKELVCEMVDIAEALRTTNAIRGNQLASLSHRVRNEFESLQEHIARCQQAAVERTNSSTDEQIDQTIRRIEERELSMDDSEGIVAMLTELKQRRSAQMTGSRAVLSMRDESEGVALTIFNVR